MTPDQIKQLKEILKDYRTVVILVASEETTNITQWGSEVEALGLVEKFKYDVLTGGFQE